MPLLAKNSLHRVKDSGAAPFARRARFEDAFIRRETRRTSIRFLKL